MTDLATIEQQIVDMSMAIESIETEIAPVRAERCLLVAAGDIFGADRMNRTAIRPKEAVLRSLHESRAMMIKMKEDLAGNA
jgi:hypothetical protein